MGLSGAGYDVGSKFAVGRSVAAVTLVCSLCLTTDSMEAELITIIGNVASYILLHPQHPKLWMQHNMQDWSMS